MSYLESVKIILPLKDDLHSKLFNIIDDCGIRSENNFTLDPTDANYLPILNFEFLNISAPAVVFKGKDLHISEEIINKTGQQKESSHEYSYLSIDELTNRLKDSGKIMAIDHLGINFPWFGGVSPVIANLRQQLKDKTAYFRFPTGDNWDFIIPATVSELTSNYIDLSIVRKPKLELVSFEKSSTPLIQIDCETTIKYEKLIELFPEAINDTDSSSVWVYLKSNLGLDICFVLRGPSCKDWSSYFEGHRLK